MQPNGQPAISHAWDTHEIHKTKHQFDSQLHKYIMNNVIQICSHLRHKPLANPQLKPFTSHSSTARCPPRLKKAYKKCFDLHRLTWGTLKLSRTTKLCCPATKVVVASPNSIISCKTYIKLLELLRILKDIYTDWLPRSKKSVLLAP